MTDHPANRVRRRVLTIGASVLAALIATGAIANACLVPPPKPAGTNNVVTGDIGREEYPNVPEDEQFRSSAMIDGCRVSIATWRAWDWTANSFRLRFRLTSSTLDPDSSTPYVTRGPNQNLWGNPTMFDEMVTVGNSYRFGPATVKVLQVWNSPIPQYRRAYLKVTFDESQILCPPPKAYTAG